MKIGLLSDTHSFLDPKVFEHFEDVDEIWHAGDIGDPDVLKKLQDFKTVRAVYGNIDDAEISNSYPEDLHFTCDGLQVWMTHIGGSPPRYNSRVKKLLSASHPDIFVCGHSHILKIQSDPQFENMLYINPGATGNHGFHHMKTIVRFAINNAKVEHVQVIELGKRGALK